MTHLTSVLDRPVPVIARRAPAGGDDGRRLIARIAGILDRNPPADAVEELKRLLAIHGARPAGIRESACDGRDRPRCVVGNHPAMLAAAETVRRVAPTDLPVLILGESGTGKGLFAEMVHRHSARSGPLVKVNCAALPEALIESELFGHERGAFTGALAERKGRFELAAGGTLFLDEIGDTSPAFQVKLLRVLQDGEFERVGGTRTLRADVRIVAATNRDLAAAIADGSFRADLYYRLSVIPVTLPPLRDRRQDIPDLARRILDDFDRETGGRHALGDDALKHLHNCDFPGNIRELENCVRRAAVMARGSVLTVTDVSGCAGRASSFGQVTGNGNIMLSENINSGLGEEQHVEHPTLCVDRVTLVETLERAGWSQAKAARLLGISSRQIGYAIKKYRVSVPRL